MFALNTLAAADTFWIVELCDGVNINRTFSGTESTVIAHSFVMLEFEQRKLVEDSKDCTQRTQVLAERTTAKRDEHEDCQQDSHTNIKAAGIETNHAHNAVGD